MHFPQPEVSFVTKIDELHQENVRIIYKLNKWKDAAAIESERRRTAESEISQLKDTIERVQIDNHRLTQYVNDWKLMAEKSESSVSKYCKEIGKIFAALEKVKSELPYIHTNHHYTPQTCM